MRTNGQGLPTPRLIRSKSFSQCVVALPNLSCTNTRAHLETKFPFLVSIFLSCRRVECKPNRARSPMSRTSWLTAHWATIGRRLSCRDLPRVAIIPTLMTPSPCSRWKFSRSRSKNGSLLFHSISRATVPFTSFLMWSISCETADLSSPSTILLITIFCLCQSNLERARRRRCVESASPPPPCTNSTSAI